MVNIRGVCRSEIKFCFSELVSIGIFTLSESLWGMMIILIGAFYDTPHFSLFDQYPITIVIVWLALSLGLFFSCLLIYDICRFAHTKKYSLIALGTIAAVFFVVVGIASKFIFDEAMMLLGSIALPSFVFSALVMDEGTGYEIGFVLFVVGLYFAILIASAIISCFRRYEL